MTRYNIEENEFNRPRIGTLTLIIPTSQLLFQSFYFLSINQVLRRILNERVFTSIENTIEGIFEWCFQWYVQFLVFREWYYEWLDLP